VLSVAALTAPSATAAANPLLSGYGGPGQGSQAILGSALVNGPGGGGGGAGGANGSAPAAADSREGVVARGVSTGAAVGGQSKPSGRTARGALGQAKTRPSAAAIGLYPASERAENAQGVLGLSADDLLYMILALGALVVAGVFTRRLARGRPLRQGAR
jgi:hypothetical protein